MDLSLAGASPEYAAIREQIDKLQANELEICLAVRNPYLTVHDPRLGAPQRDSKLLDQFRQRHAPAVPGLAVDQDRLIDSATELLLAGLRASAPAARTLK